MKARLAAIRARPDYATFIATRSGVVVGMIGVFTRLSYEHDTPIGYVTCFVVRAEERGHGVGRMLIAAAEGWAQEQGAHELTLTSHRRRKEAHAFYRHIGYAETGYRFGKPFTVAPAGND